MTPKNTVFWYFQGSDIGTIVLSHDAWDLWILGYPDQGLKRIQETMDLARELDHPFSLAIAYAHSAYFHWLRREPEKVQQYAEEHFRRSVEGGFSSTTGRGNC